MLPALLATFSSVSPNDGNLSSWQMPVGSNVEALASPELNSVSGHDFPAFGPNSPTSHYGRQLGDTPTDTWEPDRPATPAGAEHLALSDMWPIVPSGHPANRLWIRGPTGAEHDPRVISDVTPHNDWRPGARYASNSRRGSVPVRIGGRWVELEPGQANRLLEAQVRAETAIARVREIDPTWRPRPSAYEGIEGRICAYESEAEEAQARLRELAAPLPLIIPRERPATASEGNDVARAIARWLAQNRSHVIEGPDWFFEYEPSVRAYLDRQRRCRNYSGLFQRQIRDMIFITL